MLGAFSRKSPVKRILTALAVSVLLSEAGSAEERIVSSSIDGAFEFIAINHEPSHYEQYMLRESKTKKPVMATEDSDDYINPSFGSPHLQWSPNSPMFIVSAKVYREYGTLSAVFRISSDLKLVPISLPESAEPAQWTSDGDLILLVRREESYRFDPKTGTFVPSQRKDGRK
jgi:hypothetical protein